MTLYEEIGDNNRATVAMFILYAILYGAVIFAFLAVIGISPSFPLFTVSTVATLLVFYLIVFPNAPQAILSMTGARELRKKDDPYLFNIVGALAIGAGIPMPRIYIIESDALNAFATGPDPKRSLVVITTGLRGRLNRLELEGVMAHEMSHIKNYDIRSMLVATMFALAIALVADIGIRSVFYRRRDDRGGGSAIIMLLAVVGLILAPMISALIRLAISRNREYAADASGAMLTRYPAGLASALQKIQKEYAKGNNEIEGVNDATRHLFIFDPAKKSLLGLLSTHPPIEDRIARLKKM
ncbi:Protease HtpX [uncultured archaeon]|nr:Protease HtpX [uncultured archaeon]